MTALEEKTLASFHLDTRWTRANFFPPKEKTSRTQLAVAVKKKTPLSSITARSRSTSSGMTTPICSTSTSRWEVILWCSAGPLVISLSSGEQFVFWSSYFRLLTFSGRQLILLAVLSWINESRIPPEGIDSHRELCNPGFTVVPKAQSVILSSERWPAFLTTLRQRPYLSSLNLASLPLWMNSCCQKA
jgi:hypothetical protein